MLALNLLTSRFAVNALNPPLEFKAEALNATLTVGYKGEIFHGNYCLEVDGTPFEELPTHKE